ncbi:small-conductance mechanosensitive channel [Streptomyces sp. Amel2xB2]|uniref:mechanosensitive ion channel family protein n=1 Tax=Streptomyces sp. Amel2xB2 TaxID=1305829 RepID=UPI000DB9FA60|nr:mechanosensitive ion channel domain-containing protein [Streptomyces sp. Amel2xB2]RAJ65506.1 small-conductance mechanosensitive channel [Streptomyces sp. Amel2xB2]
MENVLRPLIVFGGAIVLAFAVAWGVDRLLRRIDARRPETPMWGLLRRGRVPLQAVVFVALLNLFYDQAQIARSYHPTVNLWLHIILIAATAWLVLRILAAVVETATVRYTGVAHDPARARRVKTQLTLIQRLVTTVVVVIAASAILLQFDAMRTLGTSMLASAGVLGIVAGIAAQSTLGNLFAGLSIAFGDMVRIGDEVVVDDEFGTVDEITVSYLVIRTWDERRVTMPVSYFTSKPFENWSRGGPQLTGTVYLQLDHSAPIAALRKRTEELVRANDYWDGRNWSLVVTDTTPSTIEVRAAVSARTSDDLWTLRCNLREQLLEWLQREHPYALPGIRLSSAGDRPGQYANGHAESTGHQPLHQQSHKDHQESPRESKVS